MKEHPIHKGYFFTEEGGVFSYWNRRGLLNYNKKPRELKLNPVKGYLQVTLYNKKKRTSKLVHRLVAETYIPNPNNLPFINHKDEDKTNNHINNLEWCTRQYNTEYSCSKWYKIKTPTGEIVEVFNLRKFCRENQLTVSGLYAVKGKKQNHHKGYIML